MQTPETSRSHQILMAWATGLNGKRERLSSPRPETQPLLCAVVRLGQKDQDGLGWELGENQPPTIEGHSLEGMWEVGATLTGEQSRREPRPRSGKPQVRKTPLTKSLWADTPVDCFALGKSLFGAREEMNACLSGLLQKTRSHCV